MTTHPLLSVRLARIFSILAVCFSGITFSAFAENPASDLTVVVQELQNGEIEFSVSGTAYYKQAMGSPFRTAVDSGEDLPPYLGDDYEDFTIPEGLIVTSPNNDVMPVEPTTVTKLKYLTFNSSGYWYFQSFNPGQRNMGDAMVGSGSVVTDVVPFEIFEEGTFFVEGDEFDMTYVIRAYEPKPELKVPARSRFSATRVRRTSRTSRIVVRNVGDADAENITVRISGGASRDFRIRRNPASTIAAGESSVMRASFRPRRAGARRAIVSLLSNAPTTRIRFFGRGLQNQGPIIPPRVPSGL